MKKGLIIALAALTMCVFAATASAAPTLTVSGQAEWTGYYLSNPGANSAAADAEPKSFGTMITVVSANLAIAQNLYFRVSWEGHDRYWGTTSHKDPNVTGTSSAANSLVDWNDAVMTYLSPYGTFIVGTYKSSGAKVTGAGGELAQWGMQQSKVGANRNWGGSYGTQYDMLIWSKSFGKNLNLRAYGLKYTEHDAVTLSEVDGDVWQYSLRPTYNWKTGGVYVDVRWSRVRYPVIMLASADWYANLFGISYQSFSNDIGLNLTNTGDSDWYYFYLGVAQKFGPIKVGWNSEYKIGKTEGAGAYDGETWDSSSFKYYFELLYAAGPIEAGACYSHTHLNAIGDESNNSLTVGSTFKPLYAFYSKSNVAGLGNDLGNHNLLAAWFDYNVIKNLWLHVAYGYLQWSNTELYSLTNVVPGYVWSATPYDVGKTIGSEIDFGINYAVAAGLNVGLHFGYFMPAQGWEDFMTLLKGTTDSGASYLAEAVITLTF